MAHELRMRILGARGATILENLVETKKSLPKSTFVGTWIGNESRVNEEIEYLESKGLVEYINQRKTKVKATEKAVKIYDLIGDLATELDRVYGKKVMKKVLKRE